MERFKTHPIEVQESVLKKLIQAGCSTKFGQTYQFSSIRSSDDFSRQLPVSDYEQLKPYIQRMREGEQNVLWNTPIPWFSKSSGTTSERSKYIPVSRESLQQNHYKAGHDMYSIYDLNYPKNYLFSGKAMALCGSLEKISHQKTTHFEGDISAILAYQLPFWAQWKRAPELSISLMKNWEEKIEKIAQLIVKENITHIIGVPSWSLLILQRVLKISGQSDLKKVWKNLELFIHGGVRFEPYITQYQNIIPHSSMHYLEVYNASEGYFAIQDRLDENDMLLLLDHGVYYEFMPLTELGKEQPQLVGLQDVEIGKNYAIVITTNGGLWRYLIGDTIKFTTTFPFRIQLTGRTKAFINLAGEEVMEDNIIRSLSVACSNCSAVVKEFSGAPFYGNDHQKPCHEWAIEFVKEPENIQHFTAIFDQTLQQLNSDYEAKRFKNMALDVPIIHSVSQGTFYNWMQSRGKLGGQNKVPHLANHRDYLEEILTLKNHPLS
ncbi:MAG: GH3 auxin-responsive promoter family protein [Bacteroidales bacterium]|nr:GH3 auxin-responsive promoter family protein [Bacteroidales bacterium]